MSPQAFKGASSALAVPGYISIMTLQASSPAYQHIRLHDDGIVIQKLTIVLQKRRWPTLYIFVKWLHALYALVCLCYTSIPARQWKVGGKSIIRWHSWKSCAHTRKHCWIVCNSPVLNEQRARHTSTAAYVQPVTLCWRLSIDTQEISRSHQPLELRTPGFSWHQILWG